MRELIVLTRTVIFLGRRLYGMELLEILIE
jgi:hypothetical protein